MNQLSKLIEQYEREDSPYKAKYEWENPEEIHEIAYKEYFVQWLASRPTCGVEQRKFLDDVEAKGIVRDWSHEMKIGEDSYLEQSDFTADFNKVVKGE